ncbi:MAG: PD40 domain-containing protein, partial [Alistipes sp.]|nr:PD40 domain-containing protein [Alistipes sp.]
MKKLLTLLSIAAMSIACNNTKETVEPLQLDTQMTSEEISAGVLTPRVMWRMGRLGEAKLSPDGKTVAYTVTYYNVDQNRGAASLYVMNADGSNATQLTDFAGSESDVQWSADGEKIYFLSTRSGSAQIWSIAPNGTALTQLSNIEGGINGFGIAQDGKNVWYAQTVHVAPRKSKDVYAYLPESK